MRRLRRVARRPDTKVAASGGSPLWRGMGRSPPHLDGHPGRDQDRLAGETCRPPNCSIHRLGLAQTLGSCNHPLSRLLAGAG
jgi:hypothetical protein